MHIGNRCRRIACGISRCDQPLLEMAFLIEVEVHLLRGYIDPVRRIAAVIGEAAADLVARLGNDDVVAMGRGAVQMPRQHSAGEPAADNDDARPLAGG